MSGQPILDSWEERMSARARARGAAGERRQDGSDPAASPYGLRHSGHTQCVEGNAEVCSCGEILSVWSVAGPGADVSAGGLTPPSVIDFRASEKITITHAAFGGAVVKFLPDGTVELVDLDSLPIA